MAKDDDAARYRANLQGEYDSAGLYRALADAEPDPRLKEVYGRLAALEEGHAEFWRRQLDRLGARAEQLGLGWRTRALGWLARRFGPQLVPRYWRVLWRAASHSPRSAPGHRCSPVADLLFRPCDNC
jgi:hypothetical protein